jgi:hypothetical protein
MLYPLSYGGLAVEVESSAHDLVPEVTLHRHRIGSSGDEDGGAAPVA